MPTVNLPAYFATIREKTGKTPADFRALAAEKGFMDDDKLKTDIKAMQVFDWLKADFGLGRGHGMAIYHVLKEGLTEY
jgi:hypothetical protein